MNCHGNKNEKSGKHNHNSIKHMLHMLLCCGLPILIILSLPFISRVSPGTSRLLAMIAPFICPLMMIGMIPMMFGRGKSNNSSSCCDNNEVKPDRQLELNEPLE